MIRIEVNKKFLNTFFFSFTLVLIIFTVAVLIRGRSGYVPLDCEKISIEGSYSYDGGSTFVTLNSPKDIALSRNDNMIIVGHFSKDITDHRPIYLFVQGLKVKITVNGKIVFDHP